MKKTVLFVPGFKENLSSRDYLSVMQDIERCGYDVQFVSIDWNRTTTHDWVSQLETEYRKHDPLQTVLAGFSFGALTVFVAAANKLPAELWLFSLAPFFAEDLPSIKEWELVQLGKRRVQVAKEVSFLKSAKKITCLVRIFAGSKELSMWPEMEFRFEQASSELLDVSSVRVDGVGHAIDNPLYRAAITKSI